MKEFRYKSESNLVTQLRENGNETASDDNVEETGMRSLGFNVIEKADSRGKKLKLHQLVP